MNIPSRADQIDRHLRRRQPTLNINAMMMRGPNPPPSSYKSAADPATGDYQTSHDPTDTHGPDRYHLRSNPL
ncbi:hypothetical protein PHJA_000217300 [Phtheirospermum japonicum]|uniref:Uncharacterized protein n=1 Tax=Phtheirospermum japonicum TaxID=374723 RepID=A0A830B038_9LAMI|nr:hypothetical protein PHJA_000217300 [Phtheirospermum japonicum]